ncbi:hypothetical protein [Actinokineospora inagensis]|uniref:hypothetical protein n=1 Tax=Actinokineospora inagensis TaxID=103730 RepID=UPI0012F7E12A|nr:hypothetical protein [Actinokineospora inagensis]
MRTIGLLVHSGAAARAAPLGEGSVLWVHRSVHEFLAAERMGKLSEGQVRDLLERRCWLSPEWSGVLDFTLGMDHEKPVESRIGPVVWRWIAERGDGLGWYTSVLVNSGSTAETDEIAGAVAALWRLHTAGFISSTALAESVAGTDLVDQAEVVSVVLAARHDPSDPTTWEALAWSGTPGLTLLASTVGSVADAVGAAAALYRVDPPAAQAALRRRLSKGLPVGAEDAAALAALEESDTAPLLRRYEGRPDSEQLARQVGWTRSRAGRTALRDRLHADDGAVRLAAASGLVADHGNDIDRDTFGALSHLARVDPDDSVRIGVRTLLNAIGASVPWVETAMAEMVGDLYRPVGIPSLDSADAIAAALRTTGPATELAVQMLLEDPVLETSPQIRVGLLDLTKRALLGEVDVQLTRKVALVATRETFAELALARLANADFDAPLNRTRLAAGLCLAFPADEEIFSVVLTVVQQRPDPSVERALTLSELPAERRLEILLDRFTGLTTSAPLAVGVWANQARRLLSDLPEPTRMRFADLFAMATNHVLDLP